MENKSHALAAGLFVLLASALLIGLVAWLKRDDRALRIYELASAEAVTGLQVQAGVRYKGVPVGKVIAIGLDPAASGQVLVRIAIDEQAPITRATYGSLGFQGVTGLAFIQLDDTGSPSEPLPADADAPARIPMRQSLLSRLSAQGTALLGQLDTGSQRFNQLLSPDNQQQWMDAVQRIGRAADALETLARRSDTALQAADLPRLAQQTSQTLGLMRETATRLGTSAEEVRASAAAFRQFTTRMNSPGGTLDQLATGADALRATAQQINASTLPRLDQTVDSTRRAAREVGELADTLQQSPQSLLFGTQPPTPGPGEPGFNPPPAAP